MELREAFAKLCSRGMSSLGNTVVLASLVTAGTIKSDSAFASDSEAKLEAAKRIVEQSISNSGEEPGFINRAKAALAAADQPFIHYRERQCRFYAALKAGGDKAHLACSAKLNDERAQLIWMKNVVTRDDTDSPPNVPASDVSAILESCPMNANITHVEWSECLEGRANESYKKLKNADAGVEVKLRKYRSLFESGKQSFVGYRESECELYAALDMGGNGAHDMRFACEASLNEKRVEQLILLRHKRR